MTVTRIDYFRICSFSDGDYYQMGSFVRNRGHCTPARFLQYEGFRLSDSSLFYGIGGQVSADDTGEIKRHYLIQASGMESHDLFLALPRFGSAYATRIDLQNTLTWDAFDEALADAIYAKLSRGKSIIKSDTCTVYSGQRTSEVYWRLYQKSAGFVRLEAEIKGNRAKALYQHLMAGNHPDGAFSGLLEQSVWPSLVKDKYAIETGDTWKYVRVEIDAIKARKLAWIKSIMPVVVQYANDHDIGEQVRAQIEIAYTATADEEIINVIKDARKRQ